MDGYANTNLFNIPYRRNNIQLRIFLSDHSVSLVKGGGGLPARHAGVSRVKKMGTCCVSRDRVYVDLIIDKIFYSFHLTLKMTKIAREVRKK